MTEEKIVLWDETNISASCFCNVSSDSLEPFWAKPDYLEMICKGTNRETAYWLYRIREGTLIGYMNMVKAGRLNSNNTVDTIFYVKRLAERYNVHKQIGYLVDQLRDYMFQEGTLFHPDTEEKKELTKFMATHVASFWGTEDEMYNEKFAITEEIVRKYVEHNLRIFRMGQDLEFTGNHSPKGYPEVRYTDWRGTVEKGILQYGKKNVEAEAKSRDSYLVVVVTPRTRPKRYNEIYGERYFLCERDWDRLAIKEICQNAEEAGRIRTELLQKKIDREIMRMLPIQNDRDVLIAADSLWSMGFLKCTVASNNKTLPASLIKTEEDLKTLAGIMGLPEYAMSGYGNLGIAFAPNSGSARVRGDYHLGTIRIRMNGGTALVHEWYHAIEALYIDQHDCDIEISDQYYSLDQKDHNLNIFRQIRNLYSDQESSYYLRCADIDKSLDKKYYSEPVEMVARAFEAYIYSIQGEGLLKRNKMSNPIIYPNEEELKQYADLFNQLGDWIKQQDPGKGLNKRKTSYDPEKYRYSNCSGYLIRQIINDNPYSAWEYYTEGGRWKQLPHELIVKIQNGEIKKISCGLEAMILARKKTGNNDLNFVVE